MIFHIQILGLRPNFLGTEGMAYTKMPAGMDSGAPYLPGANLIKDRSTKCLGHPREAYGALREKKLAVGQDQRATGTPGATEHSGGVGARAARHGSSQLNLTSAISWVRDMVGLSSTDTPIPELQQLAEATQIGEPASSSAEVRQLVDHLSEQAREVASEASMERTPRALAMWMAGLTLAFAISIALAQTGL